MKTKIHETLLGNVFSKKPIWIMRQAGRYLSEYRQVRSKFSSFVEFCNSPKEVAEVTLQPIQRFDFDAAIIFSDILMIPHALGQVVEFHEGIGPVLGDLPKDLNQISTQTEKLKDVYAGIRLTRSKLSNEKSLYGFAGTPWTVGAYMLLQKKIGESGALNHLFHQKDDLISVLVESISQHLINQVNAGCDVLQIFDSWAALCDRAQREQFILAPLLEILARVRAAHPETPIVYYGRGIADVYPELEARFTALGLKNLAFGLDENISPQWAVENLNLPLQGNFSNEKLIEGDFEDAAALREIVTNHPFVFNLGHGIKPQTPVENVQKLLDIWRV